jgi:hypothetical protein
MDNTPQPTKLRRPAIVTIIIALFVLDTITMVAVTAIYFGEIGVFSEQVAIAIRTELSDVHSPALVVRAILQACLLLAYVVTTIGLIRMRTWAWTSAMVLMGIRLAFGLGDYLFDSPAFDLLIFCVVLVFLLNQHEVRKAFGIVKETRVPAQHIKRASEPVRR